MSTATNPGAEAALGALLGGVIDAGLAVVRKADPDAAAEIDAVRRRQVTRPSIVVVGETKRGKSSLVNALIGVPGLSPVEAAVSTAAYLEFQYGREHGARAWLPGREEPVPVELAELGGWATVRGWLPEAALAGDGAAGRGPHGDQLRPPRRIEVSHSAPLLRYLTLVDTPGAGGLEPAHVEIALDAVARASALLFVVDASAPFTRPELDFLIEASARVDTVLFALAKIDAYPGWRTIFADDRAQLRAHAARFAAAPWFAVSARLAEVAMTMPAAAAAELIGQSRIADLQHGLIEVAGRGHVLAQANALRAVRGELVRLADTVTDRIKATDPDPGQAERARRERQTVAARKRTESRQWSLALSAETQRARVEATGRLRGYLGALQEDFLGRIDKATGEQLRELPGQVDEALHAVSVRLSNDLEVRFRKVGERALAQVFAPEELRHVLCRLNATLRHALSGKPRREGGGQDGVLVAMSVSGMAFMAGRGAMAGVNALGAGALLGGGLLVPAAGVGLGLAAGAFMLYRRRVSTDRQQARAWLREVVAEARAALTDEITHRFTDVQYALTVALDDAIERRLGQLDAHIAEIDKAMAQDKAERARRRSVLQAERDALRARVGQVDEVLGRVRTLLPATGTDPDGKERA